MKKLIFILFLFLFFKYCNCQIIEKTVNYGNNKFHIVTTNNDSSYIFYINEFDSISFYIILSPNSKYITNILTDKFRIKDYYITDKKKKFINELNKYKLSNNTKKDIQ